MEEDKARRRKPMQRIPNRWNTWIFRREMWNTRNTSNKMWRRKEKEVWKDRERKKRRKGKEEKEGRKVRDEGKTRRQMGNDEMASKLYWRKPGTVEHI